MVGYFKVIRWILHYMYPLRYPYFTVSFNSLDTQSLSPYSEVLLFQNRDSMAKYPTFKVSLLDTLKHGYLKLF